MSVKTVPQNGEGKPAGEGFKILIAEDEPIAQKFLFMMLKSFELNVDVVFDGGQVIEKVKKYPYDLIVMDLQMPVMGGIEATRIIREELHKTMPILALTANENDQEKCFAAGMNAYLKKPIEASELKGAIFYWLKGVSRDGSEETEKDSALKWDRQQGIKKLGIPEEFYDQLIVEFMKQLVPAIQDMERAFQARNFEEVAKAAHLIKGSSGNLRVEKIYVTAKELEAVVKDDQEIGRIQKQIERLKSATEELKKHLGETPYGKKNNPCDR